MTAYINQLTEKKNNNNNNKNVLRVSKMGRLYEPEPVQSDGCQFLDKSDIWLWK